MTDLIDLDYIETEQIKLSWTVYYTSRYSEKGVFIANHGLYPSGLKEYNHKWKENNIIYPFCVKCGYVERESLRPRCKISDKIYNRLYRPRHNWTKIRFPGYLNKDPIDLVICAKCGLMPHREWIYYRLDKDSKKAYLSVKASNVKKKRIPCCMTDDEWIVKDIIE